MLSKAEGREMRPDSVGYVSAGKMGVVFFCRARVGVTELLGDDAHRHAPHGERRSVGVSQYVE